MTEEMTNETKETTTRNVFIKGDILLEGNDGNLVYYIAQEDRDNDDPYMWRGRAQSKDKFMKVLEAELMNDGNIPYKNQQEIYKMKLFEEMMVAPGIRFLRVPGGWEMFRNDEEGYQVTSVFIPWNNEFMDRGSLKLPPVPDDILSLH